MVKRIVLTVLILTVATVVPHGASVKDLLSQTGEMQTTATGDESNARWFETSSGEDVREEFHQTYPLSANGRVLLENLNGNVKIAVWDRNEVQVDAVKRAFNRERLADANIEVNASPDAVRIRTRYRQGTHNFNDDDEQGRYHNPASVDYTLTVPRQARLESIELVNGSIDITGVEGAVKASSVNGRVVTRGLLGEARLTTVNGSLEATFSRLEESKPLSLASVNGNVVLIIPSNANAIVRADTVHGAISNDFGLEVTDGDYVGHELYGQIGTGGPRIKLGNVNGGIQIRHSQDGGSLSPAVNLTATTKDKYKDKDKEVDADKEAELSDAARELRESSAEIAAEAREAAREALEDVRIERQARAEAKREVDRALVEAQKEIQRAQIQVQRELRQQIRQQVREQMRNEVRGAGRGVGVGRATEREVKTFTVGASPRVNLSTFDGVVTVRAWDKPEVMYTAIKRAGNAEELKAIAIKAEQQGSLVSIIAELEDQQNGAVDFEVFVPRNVSLHASSGDGRLVLEGISGDITLRTGDGPIQVTNSKGTLMLNTGDGPIRVAGFEGQLEARTGDGPISLDGSFTGLAAETGSGTVTLSVPSGANFTLETNAEEMTNEGLVISEDVAPSNRVKRWKVGQGGKVFVITTGEGKVFLRSR